MRETVLKERLQSKPFRPFRIQVSDGGSYEIRDPDAVFILTGQVIIGTDPDEGGIPQRAIYIDPIHVTQIVHINGD